MRLMNQVFRAFIVHFVVVYVDDILVYSQCKDEHLMHHTQFMKTHEEDKLYGSLEKCSFRTQKVIFLGYIITV